MPEKNRTTDAGRDGVFTSTRVVARIAHADTIGDYVSFSFPKNAYDCDRSDIFEFINSDVIGGCTFSGGGSPGAPICAKFPKATTRQELRDTISRIMPKLDSLMLDITNGVPIPKPPPRKILDSEGREWPECVPETRSGGSWSWGQEPTAYVCSAEGRWVTDDDAVQRMREHVQEMLKREQRGHELFRALSLRVLDDDELREVAQFGRSINVRMNESHDASEKAQELSNALMMQLILQTRHASGAKGIAEEQRKAGA